MPKLQLAPFMAHGVLCFRVEISVKNLNKYRCTLIIVCCQICAILFLLFVNYFAPLWGSEVCCKLERRCTGFVHPCVTGRVPPVCPVTVCCGIISAYLNLNLNLNVDGPWSFRRPYLSNVCRVVTWNSWQMVLWQHVVADRSNAKLLGGWRSSSECSVLLWVWKASYCVLWVCWL